MAGKLENLPIDIDCSNPKKFLARSLKIFYFKEGFNELI
jgi:hypothetical protein